MGTRPGQIDPGVVLYLAAQKRMSPDEIRHFLYYDCGLKGLSGISNDMRELQDSSDPRARLAVDYFVYRIGLNAGMLAAAMAGVDGFVFTAGIGENSVKLRTAIADKLAWLGVSLDEAANEAGGPLISSANSKTRAYVIPTDEELMIARHTLALLEQGAKQRK
jgi:acetate kinase